MPTSTAFSNMTDMPIVFSNDTTDAAHANSLQDMTWLALPMPKHLNCLCLGKLFMKSWPTQHNMAAITHDCHLHWWHDCHCHWLPQQPLFRHTVDESTADTTHDMANSFFWSPQQPESKQTVTDSITDATHDMNGTANDMPPTTSTAFIQPHWWWKHSWHMTWMALPMMALQVLPLTTPRACVRVNTWPLEWDSRCHWGTARGRCSLPDFGHTLRWCSLRCWLQANKAPHLMPSYWG